MFIYPFLFHGKAFNRATLFTPPTSWDRYSAWEAYQLHEAQLRDKELT